MKNRIQLMLAAFIAITAIIISPSCNKKFDEPPAANITLESMGITPTHTIDQFKKATKVGAGGFFFIEDSMVVVGKVTANDKSGNFYKQIFIQDNTGGIEVDIEGTGLYGTFPLGREVAIICKGLYVANISEMQKICMKTVRNGTPEVLGILPAVFTKHLKTGAILAPVEPIKVTLSQLTDDLKGSLVQLDSFQVPRPDVYFYTYSDSSANKNTTNVNIENCSSQRTIIRTSAYANFAALPVPKGSGSVTAIYTVFGTTKQLLIRDTTDVQFNRPRCDGSVPGDFVIRSIQEIRALNNTGTPIAANSVIEGTIVSSTANEAAGNYRIQDDAGYGIQLRFTSAGNKNWSLGDKLRVFVEGLTVAPFSGDIQVNNVPGAVNIGRGNITPRETTIADIKANIDQWASTVVTVRNVTIASLGGGNYQITDNAGESIVTFVRNSLNYTPPVTATSVTGYASIFNGNPQITLRQPSDVK